MRDIIATVKLWGRMVQDVAQDLRFGVPKMEPRFKARVIRQ